MPCSERIVVPKGPQQAAKHLLCKKTQQEGTMLATAGRGLQGLAHPHDYLPATLLSSGHNSIGLDLWMSHVIVWAFWELNLVQPAISVHTAFDDKMGAAGSALMKIARAACSHHRSSCRSDHRHHAYHVLLLLYLLQVTFGPGLTKVCLRKLPYLQLSMAG